MKDFAIILILVLYSLAILSGTCYLIIAHGWSTWWMLLALMIAGSVEYKGKF